MMNYTQFLLIKLAEEAAEISQIALKASQFGLQEKNPKLEWNNVECIYAELNDLLGIINILNSDSEIEFNFTPNNEAINAKKEKIKKYLQYSIDLGHVSMF